MDAASAQHAIPCLLMRGGTSRGPFFNATDLPADRDAVARILLGIVGIGKAPQPDGLGGAWVTNKAAILSVKDGVVQYLFAQIVADEARVDFAPNCGNMLVAVAPAAIEMGLVGADDTETVVDIVNINTGVRTQSLVQTPGGAVTYAGDAVTDGVPGAAAPILVSFMQPGGSKSGALLPTGKTIEEIAGCPVSLIDAAMPMMWVRARDLGVTLPEPRSLDEDRVLMARIEMIRLEAGRRMGLGDCRDKVIPKVGLAAPPANGGTIAARYFTPHAMHPTFAFSGAACGASLCQLTGTVISDLLSSDPGNHARVVIEHPAGQVAIEIASRAGPDGIEIVKAGAVRTARLIMRGEVLVDSRLFRNSAAGGTAAMCEPDANPASDRGGEQS